MSPRAAVSLVHPAQSFSASPSSMERMGYFLHQSAQTAIRSSLETISWEEEKNL